MTPLKVFADTNVWFSALYGSSNCEKLLRGHLEHKISLVISQQILRELVRNIQKKIPLVIPIFERIFMSCPPEIVSDPDKINSKIKKFIDPKDQPIFASALLAKVNVFVTGNIKDFNIKELEKLTGIKILAPKEAGEILEL